MVSDWLKKEKKPTRTNEIRAVLTTTFKKMVMVFSKRRLDFVRKTTIEKLQKIFQKPEQSKKYDFLAKCIENAVLREKYSQQRKMSQRN